MSRSLSLVNPSVTSTRNWWSGECIRVGSRSWARRDASPSKYVPSSVRILPIALSRFVSSNSSVDERLEPAAVAEERLERPRQAAVAIGEVLAEQLVERARAPCSLASAVAGQEPVELAPDRIHVDRDAGVLERDEADPERALDERRAVGRRPLGDEPGQPASARTSRSTTIRSASTETRVPSDTGDPSAGPWTPSGAEPSGGENGMTFAFFMPERRSRRVTARVSRSDRLRGPWLAAARTGPARPHRSPAHHPAPLSPAPPFVLRGPSDGGQASPSTLYHRRSGSPPLPTGSPRRPMSTQPILVVIGIAIAVNLVIMGGLVVTLIVAPARPVSPPPMGSSSRHRIVTAAMAIDPPTATSAISFIDDEVDDEDEYDRSDEDYDDDVSATEPADYRRFRPVMSDEGERVEATIASFLTGGSTNAVPPPGSTPAAPVAPAPPAAPIPLPVGAALAGPRPVASGRPIAGGSSASGQRPVAAGPAQAGPATNARLDWEVRLRDEEARLSRYRRPISVVLVEVDGMERLVQRLGPDAAERLVAAGRPDADPPGPRRRPRRPDRPQPVRRAAARRPTRSRRSTTSSGSGSECDRWLAAGAVATRLAHRLGVPDPGWRPAHRDPDRRGSAQRGSPHVLPARGRRAGSWSRRWPCPASRRRTPEPTRRDRSRWSSRRRTAPSRRCGGAAAELHRPGRGRSDAGEGLALLPADQEQVGVPLRRAAVRRRRAAMPAAHARDRLIAVLVLVDDVLELGRRERACSAGKRPTSAPVGLGEKGDLLCAISADPAGRPWSERSLSASRAGSRSGRAGA